MMALKLVLIFGLLFILSVHGYYIPYQTKTGVSPLIRKTVYHVNAKSLCAALCAYRIKQFGDCNSFRSASEAVTFRTIEVNL